MPTYIAHARWTDETAQDTGGQLATAVRFIEEVGGEVLVWCRAKVGDGWLVILNAPDRQAVETALASASVALLQVSGMASMPSAEAQVLFEKTMGMTAASGLPWLH